MADALLVIDESMNPRAAGELKHRGRAATSVQEQELKKNNDPELLLALCERFSDQPWVLVTADDKMPLEHGEMLAEYGVTVATISPRRPDTWEHGREEWDREVVQRWAHSMAEQEQGTWYRYSAKRRTRWRVRRR